MLKRNTAGLWVTGLIAAITAGTLDGLAAVYILAGGNSQMVFHYVAAGALGREAAFLGGRHTVLIGLGFHYLISVIFTAFFFLMYGREPMLRKNAGVVAFIYGVLMWIVMNYLVLPVSKLKLDINNFTFKGTATGMAILIVCVALPIVLARYWCDKQATE